MLYLCRFKVVRKGVDFLLFLCIMSCRGCDVMNRKENPEDVKSVYLQVKITPSQKRELKRLAKNFNVQYPGFTMSGLVRHQIFGSGGLTDILKSALQSKRVGKQIRNKAKRDRKVRKKR